jgi:NADPH2 dehydrogenase
MQSYPRISLLTRHISDMGMDSPIPQFAHLVSEVKRRFPNLAYLSVIESRYDAQGPSIPGSNDFIRAIWSPKVLISAGGYTPESAIEAAEKASASGSTELVAFGRHFIANVGSSPIVLFEVPD